MSALFNQTNVAPGTSFAGSGSSNLNPTFASIQAASNATNYINLSDNLGNMRTATGLSSFIISYNAETDTRCAIQPVEGIKIGFFNAASGGSPGGYWAIGNNVANTPGWGIAISSISSLAGNNAAKTINVNALISTLFVAYPGCVG